MHHGSDFRNLIVSAIARRTRALSRARAGKQPRKAGRRKSRSKFSARETTVRRLRTPEEGQDPKTVVLMIDGRIDGFRLDHSPIRLTKGQHTYSNKLFGRKSLFQP
jgi:hypothetical protein